MQWLTDGIRLTYKVSASVRIDLRRGIKQGGPAHLVAHRLVDALPRIGCSVTCFADDLAAALGNAILGLRVLVPIPLYMRPAAGLVLHVGKLVSIIFPDRTDTALRPNVPLARSFTVARQGVCLGVLVGLGTVGNEFDTAIRRYRARCAYIRSVPGFLQERMRAHHMYTVGVLLFLAQLADLPRHSRLISGPTTACLGA